MTRLKVLIVDDEPPARERLRSLLVEIPDMEVVGEAVNGQQSLIRAHELAPDVVLLDVRMPGMDGYTFLERLSALPHLANVPVVVLTSTVLGPDDRERLQRASLIMSKSELSSSALIEAMARVQPVPEPAVSE